MKEARSAEVNAKLNQGLGRILLAHTLQSAREAFSGQPIRISAQAHLANFYRSAGFMPVSDPYLEDGIPHLKMNKRAWDF